MTGKSELSTTLCQRLADELGVDPRILQADDRDGPTPFAAAAALGQSPAVALDEWLQSPIALRATLRSLPSGDAGRTLKRELLNVIEELAIHSGMRLPPHFFALRGAVLNKEL